MTILALKERESLEALEEVIERGLDSFIEVGNALLVVRKEKYYREQYDTFEIYLDLRWGMNRGRAYQMIQAAEVAGNLSTLVDTQQPTAERQVRPLVALKPPTQIKAWNEACKHSKNGKPTTDEVIDAVAIVTGVPRKSARVTDHVAQVKYHWGKCSEVEQSELRAWIDYV